MTRYIDTTKPETLTKKDWHDLATGEAKPMWKGSTAGYPYRPPATIYPQGILKRHWLEMVEESQQEDAPNNDNDWSELSCDICYWANLKQDIK